MRIIRYLARRLLFVVPQVFGVFLLIFIIVRLIPGDPARLMGGPMMSQEGIELLRERMGWTGSIGTQLVNYIKGAFRGDLGISWYTGNPIATDIAQRLPATLELVVLALLLSFLVMLPIGIMSVSPGGGLGKKIAGRIVFFYGMAAGAFPDFWLALLLVYVFYAKLGWAPSPVGQLAIAIPPPMRVTGMYLFDSLLAGNWAAFRSSFSHLVLPVFTLAFVYGGGILKVAIVGSMKNQKAPFISYAKVSGLPLTTIESYIRRAIYPSVATISGISFGFLLGGAVLVETVFSWGGFGQYAVQSVVNSDFSAIQGVVLVAAILNLVIYMLVDIVYFLVDPRIRSLG